MIETLDLVLERLGRETNSSRSYIFEIDWINEVMSNTHEYVNPDEIKSEENPDGIEANIENLQKLPLDTFPDWIRTLEKNETINASNIHEYGFNTNTCDILDQQGIKSILVTPLYYGDRLHGFIGFDECKKDREWDEDIVRFLETNTKNIASFVERKKAKEEINNLAKLPGENPNPVLKISKEGKILYLNKSGKEFLGPNYSIGSFVEDDWKRMIKESLDTGEISVQETFSGDKFHLSIITPIQEKGHVTIYGKDITKRKQAEEKFRSLFETSRDAIMTLEPPKWNFTSGNNSTLEMFLAEDEADFCSRAPWQYSPEYQPDGRPSNEKAKAMIMRAMKDGSNFFDWTHRKLDGTDFSATVLLSRIRTGEKQYLQATVRDVTEQKQIQDQNLQLLCAVEDSLETIILTDLKGNVRYTNPVFEKITGYTQREVIGQNLRILKSGVHEPEFYQEMWKTLIETGLWKGKLINRRKNGEIYTEEATLSTIKNSQGEVTGYCGVKRDITDKLNIQKKLIQSERLSAIGELVSGVAHDFNNALQGIFGNIELALLQDTSPKVNDYLNTIKKSAIDAASRIQQLQRFAGKKVKSQKDETFDLKDIVDDVISQTKALWKDEAQRNGINYAINTQYGDNVSVIGNQGHLRSVLYNLIKNSVQAMPDGGTIDISTRREDEKAYLTLTDTGEGMSEETKMRIFQPFYTTKGFEQGKGLGMSGAYSIIKEHKGEIYVKNTTPGEGTSIEILLPYIKRVATEDKDKIREYHGSAKILWVDDEKIIRDLGKDQLEKLGHKSDVASSGQEALELLAGKKYDLMITDVGMPNMSGWQLAEQIKGKYEKMKIAVITGWGAYVEPEQKEKCGVGYVLGKPIEIDQLKNLVGEILQMKTK